MSRLDDFDVLVRIGGPLSKPNHGHVSMNGLGKRVRISDDRIRRALSRLQADFGHAMVENRNGRLALTTAASKILVPSQTLCALRDSLDCPGDEVESLVVELEDNLGEWLLPQVLPGFLNEYGASVHLQFGSLQSSCPANIAEGRSSFGIGFETLDATPSETLETGLSWQLILPPRHRLEELEPSEKPQLGPADRVFLVEAAPGLTDELLQYVPATGRVEVVSYRAVRECVGADFNGVGLVPSFVAPPAGGRAIPLSKLPRLRFAVYLPRNLDSLSDPARALFLSIRDVIAASASRMSPAAALAVEDGGSERSESAFALATEETP